MNTNRKRITRPRCDECGEVYMVVDNTAIRLAYPRPVTKSVNALGDTIDDQGVCPKHPRKLGYES